MKVKFKIISNGRLPEKQTNGSAGYDLYSPDDVLIPSMTASMINLGFAMSIEYGYEAQIRSRSSLALKNKIFVLNSPGTIDSDYKEEVGVLLMNISLNEYNIKKSERIAQMVFAKIYYPDFNIEENLQNTNRKGGWGSTGNL